MFIWIILFHEEKLSFLSYKRKCFWEKKIYSAGMYSVGMYSAGMYSVENVQRRKGEGHGKDL